MPKKIKFPTIHFTVDGSFTRCGLGIDAHRYSFKVPRVSCKNCLRKLGLLKAVTFEVKSKHANLTLKLPNGKSIGGAVEAFELKMENKPNLENITELSPPAPIELTCIVDERFCYYLGEQLAGI